MTYGDLSETASAIVSSANVSRIAVSPIHGIAAGFTGEEGSILGVISAVGGLPMQRVDFAV